MGRGQGSNLEEDDEGKLIERREMKVTQFCVIFCCVYICHLIQVIMWSLRSTFLTTAPRWSIV